MTQGFIFAATFSLIADGGGGGSSVRDESSATDAAALTELECDETELSSPELFALVPCADITTAPVGAWWWWCLPDGVDAASVTLTGDSGAIALGPDVGQNAMLAVGAKAIGIAVPADAQPQDTFTLNAGTQAVTLNVSADARPSSVSIGSLAIGIAPWAVACDWTCVDDGIAFPTVPNVSADWDSQPALLHAEVTIDCSVAEPPVAGTTQWTGEFFLLLDDAAGSQLQGDIANGTVLGVAANCPAAIRATVLDPSNGDVVLTELRDVVMGSITIQPELDDACIYRSDKLAEAFGCDCRSATPSPADTALVLALAALTVRQTTRRRRCASE
jgi:hypothetical protein